MPCSLNKTPTNPTAPSLGEGGGDGRLKNVATTDHIHPLIPNSYGSFQKKIKRWKTVF